MASVAAPSPAGSAASLGGFERAMITIAIMLAALMQVLDMTIANVAIPHMQTSLGATSETVTWVLTSYIVAAAIAIPITGWLADRVGRKTLFIWSITAFTAASLLCAIATNLPEMVLFRIIQGVSGAFIMPMTQAVMFDINPPEKHARAMSIFGAGAVMGPVFGPMLGGWLTENFNWRWVFLVNLPVGILCVLMLVRFMPSRSRISTRFDLFGFALLAVTLGALQMMLDRGQQEDWFHSWEIWIETGLALSAAWMFIVHMFSSEAPLFDRKMFADRNFLAAMLVMMGVGVTLIGGLALVPPLLQHLFGYSVLQAGVLTAPRGVGSLCGMVLAGRLVGKVDPRLIIAIGTSLIALSLWQMMGFSLVMDSRPIITTGLIQGFGIGLVFIPVNVLAFATLAPHFRTTGASLLTLFRNIGGSIGISLTTSLLARNIQVSHSDLGAHITPEAAPLDPSLLALPGASGERIIAMLDIEINRQASMVAYINDFYVMLIVTLACLPLVLLLKAPRRPAGPAPAVLD